MKFNLTSNINFLWCGTRASEKNWIQKGCRCDSYEVYYVLSGVFYISDGSTDFTVNAGEYLVMPPCKHKYGWKTSECSFYWFHFTTDECGSEYPLQGIYENVEMVEKYYSMLRNYTGMEQIGGNILSAMLLEFYINSSQKNNKDASEICNRIKIYIKFAPAENLKVSLIAARYGYSEKYISYKFRKEIGMHLKKYITEEIINRAKNLLENTALEIGKIGESLGYSDVHNFSHMFKNAVNVSPKEYRKNMTQSKLV